jgi:O-antigen/teichoic acid export membrane protein
MTRLGSGSKALEFNALALMVSTVATAAIGLLFWAAATRHYPVAEVGRASAVISTAALLSNVSHFNLGNVYARFLPAAGAHTRRFVRQGLALTAASALVVGTGFVLVWPTDSLFANGTERALFPLCVAVLTVFTVQDAVLFGLRAASWIPVKSVLFSLVKLALLIGLARVLPQGGLVLAWVAPAAVAVVVVVWLLHRTVMPRHMAAAASRHDLPGPRALAGFAAAEYTTGLMAYLVPLSLPLIIVAKLGTEQNAYFAVPWAISAALNMLTWNIAASLVVEAATDEESTRTLARRALRLSLVVAGGGAVVLLLGAPLLLRVFGTAYAEQGADLLRLMALAAPATAVTTVYTGVARVRRQVRRVVAVQAAIGVLVMALSLLLTDRLGVTGVGVAYLVAEGLVGLLLLFPLMHALRAHPQEGVAAPPLVRAEGTG